MKRTTEILQDVGVSLLRAELSIALVNGELTEIEDPMNSKDLLRLQKELESVHLLVTKLENTLIKKINQALNKRIYQLTQENEGLRRTEGT